MSRVRNSLTPMLTALLTALLLTAGILILAQPAHAASNFYIEDYDIDMQVNEDDTYRITETIDVHFTAPSHGIYRTIPYKIRLDRDGQLDTYYGRVYDFQILSGQKVEKDKSETNYIYKIGDPDAYADEDTTYQLSYVFDMRGDHLDGADEVYYNLIGTAWEAQSIDHVSATVTFPKAIDMENVGAKTGNQEDVPVTPVSDTKLTIDTDQDCLGGLTVRAVLPQGYFSSQAKTSNLLFYIVIALLALATAAGFLLWRRFGRDPDIIETEEFYPPEGMSAAEVAYLESGEIEGSQVTSMLLELADKGYLQIKETEVPAGIMKKKTKKSYEIIKLKEYDGQSEDELCFMQGLFFDAGELELDQEEPEDMDTENLEDQDPKGEPVDGAPEDDDFDASEERVDMEDLKDEFYTTVKEIKENITDRYAGRLWDGNAKTIARVLRGVGLVAMIALLVFSKLLNGSPFLVGNGDALFFIAVPFFEVLLPVIAFYGITRWINKPKRSVLRFIVGCIGWILLAISGFGLAVLFDTCMGSQIIPYFIGLVMVFLLYLMAALCERKTDEYVQLLGKIRGYKRFLQVAEKDRMEMLAEQDPDYFYRNLAFAFALGVTTVYAKRFADLAKEPPDWYVGSYYTYGSGMGGFEPTSMMNSMDSMMSSMTTSMTSSPSSSSGGGGFSGGGGAGGGGGGSW